MTDTDNAATGGYAGERATATGAAAAKAPWDEADHRARLTPFEQKLTTFINRRINAEPRVTVNVEGRATEVVEYLAGGDIGLGKLKVEKGAQDAAPVFVDCDETMLEMLLARIIHD